MNGVVEKGQASVEEYERIFERYLEVCNQAIEKKVIRAKRNQRTFAGRA